MTKTIPLSSKKYPGLYAIVDDEDYEMLMQHSWHPAFAYRENDLCYAITDVCVNGKWRSERMHRIIMGAKQKEMIDHIDRNGLNNTKENLRFATRQQNSMNRRKRRTNKHKYKGVILVRNGRWAAQVSVDGNHIRLGTFETQWQAAKAYNDAAKKYHGEFALLNDIPDIPDDDDISVYPSRPGNGPKRSKYKYVSWDKSRDSWRACPTVDKRPVYLGRFRTEEEAHQAIMSYLP